MAKPVSPPVWEIVNARLRVVEAAINLSEALRHKGHVDYPAITKGCEDGLVRAVDDYLALQAAHRKDQR